MAFVARLVAKERHDSPTLHGPTIKNWMYNHPDYKKFGGTESSYRTLLRAIRTYDRIVGEHTKDNEGIPDDDGSSDDGGDYDPEPSVAPTSAEAAAAEEELVKIPHGKKQRKDAAFTWAVLELKRNIDAGNTGRGFGPHAVCKQAKEKFNVSPGSKNTVRDAAEKGHTKRRERYQTKRREARRHMPAAANAVSYALVEGYRLHNISYSGREIIGNLKLLIHGTDVGKLYSMVGADGKVKTDANGDTIWNERKVSTVHAPLFPPLI
jgi:hypothetical protein